MRQEIHAHELTRKSEARGQSRWLFSFGAYGNLHVLTDARSVEQGLEQAADWLEVNAPGVFCDPPEHDEESEDCRNGCCDCEADMLYTEAGWLLAYEWSLTENPTREHLIDLAKGY